MVTSSYACLCVFVFFAYVLLFSRVVFSLQMTYYSPNSKRILPEIVSYVKG